MDAIETVKNTAANFVDKVKLYFMDLWLNFNMDSYYILKLLGCFGVGFLIGLLYKKFVRDVIVIGILFGIFLSALNYFNFIDFNYDTLKEVTGIKSTDTVGALFSILYTWVKMHILILSSIFLGFLFGSRMGS